MLGIELADGAWIFAAFIVLFLAAFIASTYTRTGSGINFHPYNNRYSDAPGARRRSSVSGREGIARLSSRGTR